MMCGQSPATVNGRLCLIIASLRGKTRTYLFNNFCDIRDVPGSVLSDDNSYNLIKSEELC